MKQNSRKGTTHAFHAAAMLPMAVLGVGLTVPAPAAHAAIANLEEVLVTARRKEESLQDVPVSMTVFSQETLDEMLATVANVPVVVLLTGRADRGWIADDNARLKAVPATHPNVTVVDWEAISAGCEGRCFYDDNIHLTQSGQNYYAAMIGTILGQP